MTLLRVLSTLMPHPYLKRHFANNFGYLKNVKRYNDSCPIMMKEETGDGRHKR